MDAETRFWERIEGEPRDPDAEDAQHWVRVYTELLATLRTLDGPAAGARVARLAAGIEDRLRFWTARLHDAPIQQARARPARAAKRRDTA